ncbi:hypothetical protein TTHERM_00497620 (macronuclear) [Tetrahymena thermophila SB210]|uniref:EF-hand domain-containing protein n=1 Tax=Tetrahymena thermophila (strain SB210) TaxID=312017 RepID=I7MK04_TETTS|nr:hypothetical protein TTHERM_00497620 [Tetrahymena thermophila SB210]EAS07708.2 hypothetical protein TTHERM_00497620 [Tetrahymena thermophila SB210]|eukprot:XP_001027950.2 hypothetical protein TTHERM_00497620 [Tetrahymena thermophila SB210]
MSQMNKGTVANAQVPRTGGGFIASKQEEENKKNIENKQKQENNDDNDDDYEDEEEEQDKVGDKMEIENNRSKRYSQRQKKKQSQKRSLDIIFDKATKQKEKQLIDKHYYQDGDPTMYTKENLQQRNALKEDPDVKNAIQKFMNIYTWDSNGKLNLESYLFVHTGLAEILRDDLQEEMKADELKFILQQDWQHDSRGKEYMTKDDLYDSLFELVDIWVPDIDKDEYVAFFEYINNTLSRKGYKNPYSIM